MDPGLAAAVAAALVAERANAAAALTAERANTAAALAQLTAELAAQRDRAADALARLAISDARQQPPVAPIAAVPVLASRRFPAGVTSALAACASPFGIPSSPSKSEPLALAPFASFDCGALPLAPELRALSAAGSLAALAPDAPLHEVAVHPHTTAHVPGWVTCRHREAHASRGAQTASTLFLGGTAPFPTIPGATVSWGSWPELLTAVRARYHPAFNGEVKSAMSGGESVAHLALFDELEMYLLLGMLGSYFRGVPAGSHRFFRAPPRAYGLVAVAHVGYLVAAEWVGKALLSVVSQPFFVASPEHATAVARLPDADASSGLVHVRVDGVGVDVWPPEEGARVRVLWRTEPPSRDAAPDDAFFWKILRGDGFEARYLRSVFAVYAALAAARAAAAADGSDPPPASLVDAELLFGAGELCVRMPWVHGRDATVDELGPGGAAVAPVAAALAWLARHGLLYVDLREPNVRVDGSRVSLIDYDDMVALERAPASADELLHQLREHGALFAAPLGEPGARPAVVAALLEEWARSSSA
jgi:hypothetical protein